MTTPNIDVVLRQASFDDGNVVTPLAGVRWPTPQIKLDTVVVLRPASFDQGNVVTPLAGIRPPTHHIKPNEAVEAQFIAPYLQHPSFRIAVLLSGSGTNLQALIDAIESKQLPNVEIVLVASNNPQAHGLQRALKHKLPAIYLPWKRRESESLLAALLQLFQVDLVVLAGWMRILCPAFLEQFPQRVINIHPALLPDDGTGSTYTTSNGIQIPVFRGLHAVQQALDAGVKVTGSCVHYVTPEVDAGPVICREEVAVLDGDNEESLHERLKVVEHRLIVEAVRRCNSEFLYKT